MHRMSSNAVLEYKYEYHTGIVSLDRAPVLH